MEAEASIHEEAKDCGKQMSVCKELDRDVMSVLDRFSSDPVGHSSFLEVMLASSANENAGVSDQPTTQSLPETSNSSATKSSIPVPPPFPPSRTALSYAQFRCTPFEIFQITVKKISLGCHVEYDFKDLVSHTLRLLDCACKLRHIHARKAKGRIGIEIKEQVGQDGNPQRENPPSNFGQVASEIANSYLVQMAKDPKDRYERSTTVIRLCLECCYCFVHRHTNDCERTELTESFMNSALLPLLEECMAVGIEDIVRSDPLFEDAIKLIYAFTSLGAHAKPLCMPMPADFEPLQRRSLLSLCRNLGELVSNYVRKSRCPGTLVEEDVCEEAVEPIFSSILATVRELEAVCADACDPLTSAASTNSSSQNSADVAVSGSSWQRLPSVVTWASGRVAPDWVFAAATAAFAATERSYEQEMAKHKVEGVVGLKRRHHFKDKGSKPFAGKVARKLLVEIVALERSLPLSLHEGAVVRFDEERADFAAVMIFGSADTPYAGGAFEFHVHCGGDYPNLPPAVWLMTTGRGGIRFNPNLYEDGLVCSSLLNQGSGWGPTVTWRAGESNLLEVVQSLMWVHMNAGVYYAEPDVNLDKGTEELEAANEAYCDIVRYGTVKYAMVGQLRRPPEGFEEAVRDHFRLKRISRDIAARRTEILRTVEEWLETARSGDACDSDNVEQSDRDALAELPADESTLEPEPSCEASSGLPMHSEPLGHPENAETMSIPQPEQCSAGASPSVAEPVQTTTGGVRQPKKSAVRRNPVPNYQAEYVQAHNQTLADRFDQGYYYAELKAAIEELRAELAKL